MLTPEEQKLCRDLRADPSYFNSRVLGREPYWEMQRQICRSVVEHPTTLVVSGNAVGKTYVCAGLILWFLLTRPRSLVVATAPTQVQLAEVLWKEVVRAYQGARIPLGGRMLRQPLKIDLGSGWQALAYSTDSTERFSGHHAADLLTVMDEASGVDDAIYEAFSSLNPSREVLIGNPLRPDGQFYYRCTRATEDDSPQARLIHIPSLASPHIHLERSPFGLADKNWLLRMKADYGEGSLWWKCHVLGEFPDEGADSVLNLEWLRLAEKAEKRPAGKRRMAIDLALGGGGDRSVIIVRDDNVLLEMWWSNKAKLEDTASKAALLYQKWDCTDISYDVEGIGADFGNRLRQVNIPNPVPYRGGEVGSPKQSNFRSYAAWRLRQRLDPQRLPREPFHIPTEYLRYMQRELLGLRYKLDEKGRIKLEKKEDFVKRLGHSPDFADCLSQAFAFDE